MHAGDQIGQEFYWRNGKPIGRIHNGYVIKFGLEITDYKSYLRNEIRVLKDKLKELETELQNELNK